MSEHEYITTHHGRLVTIRMGWDKSQQDFFMVIQRTRSKGAGVLYSSATDPDLMYGNGLASSLEHFKLKLQSLGLSAPPVMLEQVVLDGLLNIDTRLVWYDKDGNPGSMP